MILESFIGVRTERGEFGQSMGHPIFPLSRKIILNKNKQINLVVLTRHTCYFPKYYHVRQGKLGVSYKVQVLVG